MADGSEKPIQSLVRGEIIAGDLQLITTHKVARVIESSCSTNFPINIIKIDKDALGLNMPNRNLTLTSGHKIIFNGIKSRARTFKNINGVRYHKLTADKALPDDNGMYYLYNLQFDHDGEFIGNGLVLESIPVNSKLFPLDKDLYFDNEYE